MRCSLKRFLLSTISYFAGLAFMVAILTVDFVPDRYVWINVVVAFISMIWIVCFCWVNGCYGRKEGKDV